MEAIFSTKRVSNHDKYVGYIRIITHLIKNGSTTFAGSADNQKLIMKILQHILEGKQQNDNRV